MLERKPLNTPIDHNNKLGINLDKVPVDKRRYRRLVGKLIHLSHTRLNIAYIVDVTSQFMHVSIEDHLEAIVRILKYLKATPDIGLLFSKGIGLLFSKIVIL